ncbi:MAG: ATP-dependent protease ATPase subunit HslU [Acidobacteriota bacterium]|nr:ATP-dependent protease ATPase subunit HslU [Acidobacteriota bacterium]
MSESLINLTQSLPNLTPREIVEQLDRYIIGQEGAKRACAIALRNRRRRQMVTGELKDEILPKNILMVGATGVGKTEIARRLAKLSHSPFMKVEASKFTEVGYVGRDVESMIRDLVEISVNMVKEEQAAMVRHKAAEAAIEKVLDLLHPPLRPAANLTDEEREAQEERHARTREKYRKDLEEGKLDERKVEMDVTESSMPSISFFGAGGMEEMGFQIKDMLSPMFGGGKTRRKHIPVPEALERLRVEEEQKLIDMDQVVETALERVENNGIIFLDEIDKIAGSGRQAGGPDVSRGGVQRDLLPIIEGCTVSTKHGMIRTDHILFIAAGAFHVAKPSDLLPELQGRLPIKVDLDMLTEEDFYRILLEPQNSLIKQNKALMETEEIDLELTDGAVRAIARIAFHENETTDNIGARRLHAVMERVMEDLFFDSPEMEKQSVTIDEDYVVDHAGKGADDHDLKNQIL